MKERAQEREQVGGKKRRLLIICFAKDSVTIVILRLVHTTLPAMLTF